jgi:hypothetical protein
MSSYLSFSGVEIAGMYHYNRLTQMTFDSK